MMLVVTKPDMANAQPISLYEETMKPCLHTMTSLNIKTLNQQKTLLFLGKKQLNMSYLPECFNASLIRDDFAFRTLK